MIGKFIGREVEIIYLDRKDKFTQRRIRVSSIKDGVVKAYCLEQKGPRIFVMDRILAVQPSGVRRHG